MCVCVFKGYIISCHVDMLQKFKPEGTKIYIEKYNLEQCPNLHIGSMHYYTTILVL